MKSCITELEFTTSAGDIQESDLLIESCTKKAEFTTSTGDTQELDMLELGREGKKLAAELDGSSSLYRLLSTLPRTRGILLEGACKT